MKDLETKLNKGQKFERCKKDCHVKTGSWKIVPKLGFTVRTRFIEGFGSCHIPFGSLQLIPHSSLKHDDSMTEWQNHRMTESQNDRITEWQKHRMTETQNDRNTEWQHLCHAAAIPSKSSSQISGWGFTLMHWKWESTEMTSSRISQQTKWVGNESTDTQFRYSDNFLFEELDAVDTIGVSRLGCANIVRALSTTFSTTFATTFGRLLDGLLTHTGRGRRCRSFQSLFFGDGFGFGSADFSGDSLVFFGDTLALLLPFGGGFGFATGWPSSSDSLSTASKAMAVLIGTLSEKAWVAIKININGFHWGDTCDWKPGVKFRRHSVWIQDTDSLMQVFWPEVWCYHCQRVATQASCVCPPLKINGLLKSSLKAVNKVYFVNVAGGLTTPHAGCCQVQKLASPNIDISIAPSWPFWPAMLSQIWCSTSASRARSELVLRQSLWPFRVKPH